MREKPPTFIRSTSKTVKNINVLRWVSISPLQYFFLSCIHKRDYNAIKTYQETVGPIGKSVIRDLVERGLIIDMNKKGEFFVDAMVVSDKFIRKIVATSDVAGQELWNTYPWYFHTDVGRLPAKTVDKDEVIKTYLRRINHSYDKHQYVMRVLKNLIENDAVSMGIGKWVASEQWYATSPSERREEESTQNIFDLDE